MIFEANLDTNEDKRAMLESTFKKDKFESEETAYEFLHLKIESILEKISSTEPQMFINGYRNVWIAKPNCKLIFMKFCREEEGSNALITYTI